jgi:hypothetical protein
MLVQQWGEPGATQQCPQWLFRAVRTPESIHRVDRPGLSTAVHLSLVLWLEVFGEEGNDLPVCDRGGMVGVVDVLLGQDRVGGAGDRWAHLVVLQGFGHAVELGSEAPADGVQAFRRTDRVVAEAQRQHGCVPLCCPVEVACRQVDATSPASA